MTFRTPQDVLVGRRFSTVEQLGEKYWVFSFGDTVQLSMEQQWRLMSLGSIMVTSEDDGQKFGLNVPVDAVAMLTQALKDAQATAVELQDKSSDLRIHFNNAAILEVLNMSSGYESWTLSGDNGFIWVGRNE